MPNGIFTRNEGEEISWIHKTNTSVIMFFIMLFIMFLQCSFLCSKVLMHSKNIIVIFHLGIP